MGCTGKRNEEIKKVMFLKKTEVKQGINDKLKALKMTSPKVSAHRIQ